MVFKYCILFVTYLAANFGCNQFRIMPEIVSRLLHISISVAVQFDWNLCRLPILRQVVIFNLCTGFNSEHTGLFQFLPMRKTSL